MVWARLIWDCSQEYGTGGECVALSADGMGKTRGNYRDTVIYNSFVLAQVFNEFNARKIYNEMNM